ncbi:MAG: DUF4296 domain-containing protein [Flavobacteriia bacterium]|jgi:hypothetical protein
MRWIFYSLITAILFSCKEKGAVYSEPDDLIPRDTMVILLKDLTLIEAHVQNKYNSVVQYQKTMIRSGNEVLKAYGISPDRLDRSMDYYSSNQKMLSGIYSEILDSLNREASMFEPSQMVKKDTVLLPQNRQGKGPLSVRPTF